MTLIDAALSHARTVLSILLLILICGSVAYIEIPKEANPDINIPIIYVSMSHEGISPESAERLLIRPMEQGLRSIEGVKEIRASGFEGGANVTLEFDAGFDADIALNDVREKVDLTKPELPDETEEPEVHEVNFSLFPVVVVTLSGQVPERPLIRLARDLKDRIEGISSVLSATIAGDRAEMIEILIDPVKIESYGLSLIDAVNAVQSSNVLVAAGAQDTGRGRFTLKVPGLFKTVRDVYAMPIKVFGDAVVTLGDIGDIRRSFKDPTSFARVHGRKAVAVEISKRTGENIIDTIAEVRIAVEAERLSWPETLRQSVRVGFTNDRSNKIRNMLADLKNSVIAAVLLVMIVVVSILGLRTAGLVGIAIPGSFLASILVLATFGFTINIVVLFALILAVGMLVDGAIVVTEYADRKMTEGEPRQTAYRLAAKRMSWPIIASTATTLAAFLPLLFWPGVVGEFMKFLPLTLVSTLTASLMMALIFVPTLGAHIGKPGGAADPKTMKELAAGDHVAIGDIGGFTGFYLRLLDGALDRPGKILASAVLLLVGVQVVYANFGRGVEFFPDIEPDFIKLQVKARGNLSVMEKDLLLKEVEERILALNTERGEFDTVYIRSGQEENTQEAEDIVGTITLELADWQTRRKAEAILTDVEERTHDLAGIIIDRRKEEHGPPVGKAIQVQLSSRFPELLAPAIARVREGLDWLGGFENVEDSRPLPGIDWEMTVDRAQAAKFGANVDLIGRAVQMISTGIKLGEYRPDDIDDEIDIRTRYPEPYRTIEQIDNIRIQTTAGQVPLGNFVSRTAKPRVGKIKRTDGKRVMTIKADVVEGLLADDKVGEIQEWLIRAGLDSRIDVKFKGEDEEQKKAEKFLTKAFAVALFIMAVILVTQFNSFYSAFLILSAVVMSTIGVFMGLLVTGKPFGIVMGGIGVIALAGIVVNNNIVLIDTFDRLCKTEEDRRTAIIKTGAQRLRPVLLTTVTTVLGLLPMVLGINIDFISRTITIGAPAMQWWRELSTSIVFGLSFATVLTLVVTPCSLMLRANLQSWRKRRRFGSAEARA